MNNEQLEIHNSQFTIHNSSSPPTFRLRSGQAFHSSTLPFIHPSNSSTSLRTGLPILLLILMFALFFAALSIQQHHTYQTHGLDLGNVDQALWNTAHGRFLNFTLMAPVENRLALHVEPILLLLVPFYWLGLGSPELLLLVQAVVVALGAWPLYQLAMNNEQLPIRNSQFTIHNSLFAYVFPLAYLLLPTLQSAVLFDFHAVTLAPTFLLFAFLALEQHLNGRFALFAMLAMACKEDMPLVVAMVGLYAGLAQRRWSFAGLTVGLSLLWFYAAVFLIQPRFAVAGNIQLDRYAWLGRQPLDMVINGVTQPGLVLDHLWAQVNLPAYLFNLFWPTAFLALLSPLTLLPMLPPLAVNLLSDNPFTWRLEDFHYGASLAPFLFISAIHGVRRCGTWSHVASPNTPYLQNLAVGLVLIFSLISHYQRGYTPLARPFAWPPLTPHHQQLEAILETLPTEAPLFAQPNLSAHLTHRQTIYDNFAAFTDPGFPASQPVQHILLDITRLENSGGLHQYLRQTLFDTGRYRLVTAQDGILHLATDNEQLARSNEQLTIRNSQFTIHNSQVPQTFYTFTNPDTPPGCPLQIDFGDALRLHGFTLHFNRQEEVQVSVDLAALQPVEAIQLVLYLLDAEGQPQGATTDLQPTLVWYPVEQWPPGERVRVRFNTFPWHTRETKTYRLALGIIRGNEPWLSAARLRPTLSAPTGYVIRLPDHGTLVELAEIKQVWSMPAGGPALRRFSRPSVPYPVEADFGGQLRLLGYGHVAPLRGDAETLSIRLYWQALAEPESLTRFVQLIGPDGRIYGQQDSAPDGDQYPTDLWQPGEIVIETVTFAVQPHRPAGAYQLHLGLYRPQTGQRLVLDSGGDHVEIKTSVSR
jgi:uncharacterized membrane protein